jgi:hypothetical protein
MSLASLPLPHDAVFLTLIMYIYLYKTTAISIHCQKGISLSKSTFGAPPPPAHGQSNEMKPAPRTPVRGMQVVRYGMIGSSEVLL